MEAIGFSINGYDKEGDVYEEGIYLHFGNARILVATTVDEMHKVAQKIEAIAMEIDTIFYPDSEVED